MIGSFLLGLIASAIGYLIGWSRGRRRGLEESKPDAGWWKFAFAMGKGLGKLESAQEVKKAQKAALTQAWEIASMSGSIEEATGRIADELEAVDKEMRTAQR